jgi:hypothetical protein
MDRDPTYVVCLRSDDADDLQVGKRYQLLPDDSAADSGYVRVVDESGEDYLYAADRFDPMTFPNSR